MGTIYSDIKNNYKNGTSFTKLLYINIAVFLIYNIAYVILFLLTGERESLQNFAREYFFLHSNLSEYVRKPWTILSYMFLHTDFIHLLINLIWLHFGSKIFLQYFTGKQLLSTYILGGIAGGVLYILSFNVFPAFQYEVETSIALGASASVLAIIIAIATYAPNYSVQFPFIGSVKLKHIAYFAIILDLISIKDGNAGGHIAHLGGVFYGFIYILLLKKGMDLSVNFHKFIGYFAFTFQKKNRLKKVHKRNKKGNDDSFRKNKSDAQKQINLILEKISKSGYESLTNDEKNILFKESKK
ncbi:MAG: rhomboid family intramembrane serine protease [Flavobacteriales bacterium]